MANQRKEGGIAWTDETWNPLRGCSKVSEGCRNCYAASMAARFSGEGMPYEGLAERTANGANWTGKIKLVPESLDQPLKWKRPRKIFVNSMSDLFHKDITTAFIEEVFAIMAVAPQHTYQVLTKRPERMAEWFENRAGMVSGAAQMMGYRHLLPNIPMDEWWPLSNVWLGTSVENKDVLHRIDELRKVPAAIRFLSIEPLIGDLGTIDLSGISWVIVGGESGRGARPIKEEWVTSIRDQCQEQGVNFFFKQWGGVNKSKNGRLLEGKTWNEFPEVTT